MFLALRVQFHLTIGEPLSDGSCDLEVTQVHMFLLDHMNLLMEWFTTLTKNTLHGHKNVIQQEVLDGGSRRLYM